MSDTGMSVSVADTRDAPREGYFQVSRQDSKGEIVPYSRVERNWFRRYLDINERGCFRQAFGSPRTNFADGDFAVFLPVRYWDLYEANVDSLQGVIFQTSHEIKDAYWRRITWEEEDVQGRDIKILLRFNGSPDWSSAPVNEPGGLYIFDDPQDDNLLKLQADLVEIRVYFTYQKDAYRTSVWKSTPVLRSIEMEYTQPPVVHMSEVLED